MQEGGIVGKFVEIKQSAGIKAACPPAGIAGFELIGVGVIRFWKAVGGYTPHQDLVLIDALPEVGVDEPEQGRLWLQVLVLLGMGGAG